MKKLSSVILLSFIQILLFYLIVFFSETDIHKVETGVQWGLYQKLSLIIFIIFCLSLNSTLAFIDNWVIYTLIILTFLILSIYFSSSPIKYRPNRTYLRIGLLVATTLCSTIYFKVLNKKLRNKN